MNEAMFAALMDPAGAPAHPLIFLVLGIVTFALHIVAVSLMLGSLGLSLKGVFSPNPFAQRLAKSLAFTAKVSVAFAIVLGVAPLLFVQVIYDPFWYSSSMISATWTLTFLVGILLAYLSLYAFGGNREAGNIKQGRAWLFVAFVLLLACGWIMHALSNQTLFPERFMDWYAPNGVIDPSGNNLHYTLVPRLLFFLALSLPVTAAWLYGMRRYLLSAGETDYDYIDYIESIAHRTALIGGVTLLVTGVWWMVSLPESMQWFTSTIWPWIGLIAVAYMIAMPTIQKKRKLCIFCNYMAFGMTVIMTILLATMREILRYGTLAEVAGWSALSYKVNFDWASTTIFFATFLILGGVCLTYLVSLAWQAGQAKGSFELSSKFAKFGPISVAILGGWVVLYFVIGIATIAMN